MSEIVVNRQKLNAKINGKFDALMYLVEFPHDGQKFFFGTGLVTTDFHKWFGEQVTNSKEDNEFEGRVFVEFEDNRVGRALISHVERCDEAGSKIAFVFQGGLVLKPTPNEANNE